MTNFRLDPLQYGLDADIAIGDENVSGFWVEPSRRSGSSNAAAMSARPAPKRETRQPPEPSVPHRADVQVHHLLKAWSEGCYARASRSRLSINRPYPEGSEMALAWEEGWQFGQ